MLHMTIKTSKTEEGVLYRSEKSNSLLCHFMSCLFYSAVNVGEETVSFHTWTSPAAGKSVQLPSKVLDHNMYHLFLLADGSYNSSSYFFPGWSQIRKNKAVKAWRRVRKDGLGRKQSKLFRRQVIRAIFFKAILYHCILCGWTLPLSTGEVWSLMRLSSPGHIPALRHYQLYADHRQMTDWCWTEEWRVPVRFQKFLWYPIQVLQ